MARLTPPAAASATTACTCSGGLPLLLAPCSGSWGSLIAADAALPRRAFAAFATDSVLLCSSCGQPAARPGDAVLAQRLAPGESKRARQHAPAGLGALLGWEGASVSMSFCVSASGCMLTCRRSGTLAQCQFAYTVRSCTHCMQPLADLSLASPLPIPFAALGQLSHLLARSHPPFCVVHHSSCSAGLGQLPHLLSRADRLLCTPLHLCPPAAVRSLPLNALRFAMERLLDCA